MSVWYGWPTDRSDETFEINASEVNLNLNTNSNSGTIFNGSITTSNWITGMNTFRDPATFTINPFDKKHEVEKEQEDFQEELVKKLNDRNFQAAARQRYKILAGIVKTPEDMKARKLAVNAYGHIMSQEETAKQQVYRDDVKEDFQEFKENLEKDDTREELAEMPSWWNASYRPNFQKDDSELPTRSTAKSLKELTQELQYDLDRERDVAKCADLIIDASMCIRNKVRNLT